jgi:DNA-binding NarL/FixJ family response regulator
MSTRVLVADTHAVVRRGLRELLSEGRDVTVGEATSAEQALQEVQSGCWDIVILELSLPGRGGLELIEQLRRERPALPILVLTSHPEDQYGVRALRCGASGYLTKDCAPEQVQEAVCRLLAGGRYVSLSLAEKLAGVVCQGYDTPAHEQLSNRELQVFERLAIGRTVGQVAQELHLSVKTISTYRARVLDKLALRTNAELILYAMRHELLV